MNGMDSTIGLNLNLANAPAATAIIKFAGGAQGFDGAFGATTAPWADDANALRIATLTGQTSGTPLEIDITNGAELVLSAALSGTITAPLTISGVANGDPTAGGADRTTGRVAITAGPYTFTNGLTLANTLQLQVGGGLRLINGNITLSPGANVGFQGRGTATAVSTPSVGFLQLGSSTGVNSNALTISGGATAGLDLRFRTDLATAHGIQLFDRTNILAGGTLKFTHSYTSTVSTNTVAWIEVQGDITGNGTTAAESTIDLRLPAANTAAPFTNVNGVTFDSPGPAGADLIVNGTGFGGLKVSASGRVIRTSTATGAAATYLYGATGATDPVTPDVKLSNLLTQPRLAALTGSGGYLTPAATGVAWSFPAGGEWSVGVPVGLRVANSNPSGISVSLSGLTSFTHNVALDPGATLDLGSSNFTFGPAVATTGLGLISGSGTISGTGAITMSAGTTVMPGLNGIGTLTVGNMTLNGTLQLDTTSTPTNDILAVNGTLTLGAGSVLILPNTNTYTSAAIDYTLATFSGLAGTFGTVTGTPAGFQVVYGANSITLHNNSIVTNTWNGNLSGVWDLGATANWKGPSTFANGNVVIFDGTASGPNFTVTVTGGNVAPGSVTVDTTGHDYTLISSAAAQITGTTALTKNGTGSLTLSGPASYTGGTTINNGTLKLGSANALPPTGTVLVGDTAVLDTLNHNNILADLTVNGAVNGTGSTLQVNSLTLGSFAVFEPNLKLQGPVNAITPNGLTLPGNIDLGGATRVFTVGAGTGPELSLNGVISNGGLTKSGNGMLVLANPANSYTGGTTVTAGTLLVAVAGALPTGTGLTINGGTLDANGLPLTLSSLAGSGGTLDMNGAALNLAQSTSTAFTGAIIGNNTTVTKTLNGVITLSGPGSTFSGGLIINAGAVIGTGPTATGSGTVTVNPGGDYQVGGSLTSPIDLEGGTLSSQGTPATATNTSLTVSANSKILLADVTNLSATGDMPVTGTLLGTGNLLVSIGNTATSADGGPGFRLRGAGASTYSGTITAGPNVKVEMQSGTLGPAQFSPAGTANFILTAGTQVAGSANGTYSEILVRNNSAGDIFLGNNITLTGTVAGGTAWAFVNTVSTAPGVSAADPLGSVSGVGNVTLGDQEGFGSYRMAGNVAAVRVTGVTLTGGTSTLGADPVGFSAAGVSNLILGPIIETASTNVNFSIGGTNVAPAVPTTILLSAANTYTGSTTLVTGSIGTLALGAPGALPAGTALTVNAGTVDLNFNGTSNDQTVGSLAGVGGTITNSDAANTRTLTVNQSAAGGTTSFFGAMSGNLSLTKSNNGTLSLASGTYTGQTLITGGILSITGALASPTVTVANGALNGTGTLAGNVVVGDGTGGNFTAIIDPADNASIGTLTMASLSLANSDAAYVLELNSTGLTTDLLSVTGALALGNGVAHLAGGDLSFSPLQAGQTFVVAQSPGGVTGFFAGLPEGQQFAIGGNQYTIDYQAAGGTEIVLTSVPEPGMLSSLTAGLGLLTGLGRFRRRR